MPLDWSRLRSVTTREVIRSLGQDGFLLRRQTGSHRIYRHPDGRKVTVSFHHPGQTFRIGTLRRMLQEQARWTAADLRRLGLLR